MKYDYLIVGAGLFGAVFAHEMTKKGKKCLVIDKREHIGGNIYTKEMEGIQVHQYGAHIFHTKNKKVWEYMQSFASFNRYTNSPIARYKDEIYNLPFNMNTFHALWGVLTPQEAKRMIDKQRIEAGIETPSNLEEQAICLVGKDIYEKLIKGYTEKQWGKKAAELPSFIIKRLPVRFIYDNNYFNDAYQGIPEGGYTQIIEKLLQGSEVLLRTNYFDKKEYYSQIANRILFTGMIDEFYGYCYGALEYRSLHFVTEVKDEVNFQGNAVVNYTDYAVAYTRIIEHKHFEYGVQDKTVITYEYPKQWKKGDEPYYPINDDRNAKLYEKYKMLAEQEEKIVFGGRLGLYQYLDMDQIVEKALELSSIQE